jgi:hypothetical protein
MYRVAVTTGRAGWPGPPAAPMALGAHPEASMGQRTGETFEQKHAIAPGCG